MFHWREDGVLSCEFATIGEQWLVWGVVGGLRDAARDATMEVYVIGLKEKDNEERSTRDRRLVTPGARYYREPNSGAWDFEIEFAYQLGTASASSSSAARSELRRREIAIGGWGGASFSRTVSPTRVDRATAREPNLLLCANEPVVLTRLAPFLTIFERCGGARIRQKVTRPRTRSPKPRF